MGSQLNTLFYIGIIIPTAITIGFFIGFLVCWFQCNLKKKLLDIRSKRQESTTGNNTVKEAETNDNLDKASQHSIDSAIDVDELEMGALDAKETLPNLFPLSHIPHPLFNNNNAVVRQPRSAFNTAPGLTEAEIYTSLSRGSYPSHEKLNDEITSEPRIYDTREDLELAIYNGLARPEPPIGNRSYLYNPTRRTPGCNRHECYSSAPRLLANKRSSYSNSLGPIEDNHVTDYGFAPWLRPNSVCGGSVSSKTGEFQASLSLPKRQYAPSNITWNTNFIGSSSNPSGEILHV